MTVELYHGDCLDILDQLEADSVDTVITDTPAGISFMGKLWDNLTDHKPRTERGRQVWLMLEGMISLGYLQPWEAGFLFFTVDWATKALRVAKPGGPALVWAIPRTSDLTKFGLRLAGWEIRDTLYHLFGSGFPKSANISKLLDKAAGAEREVVGVAIRPDGTKRNASKGGKNGSSLQGSADGSLNTNGAMGTITAPATDAAQLWDGWGTALKPAVEEWILAMKPRQGTFAENALAYGCAGLWIDGCRVGLEGMEVHRTPAKSGLGNNGIYGASTVDELTEGRDLVRYTSKGRWPANLLLDEEAARLLDEQSGERPSRGRYTNSLNCPPATLKIFGHSAGKVFRGNEYAGETGGASRFFYTAKASRSERESGLLGHIPCLKCGGMDTETHIDPKTGKEVKCRRNGHPTVKPLELCRWLCRLTATPTGGVVLDPFCGSGRIPMAAVMEGRDAIGIELEQASYDIAYWAVQWAQEQVPVAVQASFV